MMNAPSFDEPLPFRSVIPPTRMLNTLSAVTFVALVVAQILCWPMLFGFLLPSLTVALATPLLAFVPSGLIVGALRNREATAWARAHGFTYQRRPGWDVPRFDVAPFNIGRARRRRIVSAMTGAVGNHPAWYVHYRWLNNNRVQVSTHYRNVFALTLPRGLPPLTIGPTISPDAGQTVKFESIDFNEKWWVTCPDARFAKAAITPQTMDRLLALDLPVTATTRIVIVGHELLAISMGGSRGSDITRIYAALRIIADGIPRYVRNEWSTAEPEFAP
jgi:hypothetical protein